MPDATCECRREQFCPTHRYRWEYAMDERHAHTALDALGAPTIAGPPPGDMILSVAGRIQALGLTRTCRTCAGHGSVPGFWYGTIKTCPACHGAGQQRRWEQA